MLKWQVLNLYILTSKPESQETGEPKKISGVLDKRYPMFNELQRDASALKNNSSCEVMLLPIRLDDKYCACSFVCGCGCVCVKEEVYPHSCQTIWQSQRAALCWLINFCQFPYSRLICRFICNSGLHISQIPIIAILRETKMESIH